MNMALSRMFQKARIFITCLFVICLFFSSGGCKSRILNCNPEDRECIVKNYLIRLDRKDKSLLEELNSITDKNLEISGKIEILEGSKKLNFQLKNIADTNVIIHQPEHSIMSSIFQMDGKKWVDSNIVIRPSIAIPYVVFPGETLKFSLPLRSNFPDDINTKVVFSMPKYNNIGNKGILQYSEYRLIKRFEATSE